MPGYTCKVIRWLDGDTLDVAVDLGFFLVLNMRVRVYGINAPEIHSVDPAEKRAGQAALAHANLLVPPDSLVTIRGVKGNDKEKFGRWLAEIVLPDGRNFAEEMIATGQGKPYFGGKR